MRAEFCRYPEKNLRAYPGQSAEPKNGITPIESGLLLFVYIKAIFRSVKETLLRCKGILIDF